MSSERFTLKPIGVIRSPFKNVTQGVPIQGMLKPETRGTVDIFPEFAEGLKDLEGFSNIYLIYLFNMCEGWKLTVVPYLDTGPRGVFSTRSPHRPNHIGLTLVKLLKLTGNVLTIAGIDMIDGTPVIDIKPYNPAFDSTEKAAIGWMEPYFNNGKIPDTATTSMKQWKHE